MIKIDLSTGNELASLITELRGLGKKVDREMRADVARVERELDNSLTKYAPPKPPRPIQWTSERQRRWVMANVKLPHVRRGIQRLWRISVTVKDGVYTVNAENPSDAARWVYSPMKSRQAFLKGWSDPEKEVIEATVKLEAAITAAVDKAIKRL